MANIMDYLTWRGDITFDKDPINEVDCLIFSKLCYLDFSGIVPNSFLDSISLKDICKEYFKDSSAEKESLGVLVPDEIPDLLKKAAESERFADVRLSGFVNEISESEEKQFSAVTVEYLENKKAVVFRGTDDTITGWKENFNMSYKCPVPAQTRALEYFNLLADGDNTSSFVLCGHSKGGNLAVFSAIECDDAKKDRIETVYNFDGPGFFVDFSNDDRYKSIEYKIKTFMPQDSVVGILLEHHKEFTTVKSTNKGAFQHNGFSWVVKRNKFVVGSPLSGMIRREKALDAWIDELDVKEREEFINIIFSVAAATKAKTLTELVENKVKNIKIIWETFSSFDKETKDMVLRTLHILFKEDKNVILQTIQENIKPEKLVKNEK